MEHLPAHHMFFTGRLYFMGSKVTYTLKLPDTANKWVCLKIWCQTSNEYRIWNRWLGLYIMLHIHSYPSMHFCFQFHVCNSDLVVYLYYMYTCTYMYINYNMCINRYNIYIYIRFICLSQIRLFRTHFKCYYTVVTPPFHFYPTPILFIPFNTM